MNLTWQSMNIDGYLHRIYSVLQRVDTLVCCLASICVRMRSVLPGADRWCDATRSNRSKASWSSI